MVDTRKKFERVAQAEQVQPQCFFCKKVYEEGHVCGTRQRLEKIVQSTVKYL